MIIEISVKKADFRYKLYLLTCNNIYIYSTYD